MMLFGCIFLLLDPILTIGETSTAARVAHDGLFTAAAMSFCSPFAAPLEKREEADKIRQVLAH